MDLKINIDIASITAELKEFGKEIKRDIKSSTSDFAKLIHSKIVEMANEELKTLFTIYQKNLRAPQSLGGGSWLIILEKDALWIESGVAAGDMKERWLKGKNSMIIPFQWNIRPAQMSQEAQKVRKDLFNKLDKMRIGNDFKKIQYNKIEKPMPKDSRVKKLLEFSIPSTPLGAGNTPALSNVNIYQSQIDKGIQTNIMTFRTMSKRQTNKWIRKKAIKGQYMDRAKDWAEKEFHEKILPKILDKYK